MKIRKISVDELIPAEYNPRKDLQPGDDEYEKLRKSIREFGYVEPIVMNERTGRVVGGHQRLKVLKEEGYNEVDVIVVDFDESREKALNIALNKISGEWDESKLKDLLIEIDTGEFDIEVTGFDETEIADLIEVPAAEAESSYTDKIQIPTYEPKEETKPDVSELYDMDKASDLIRKIEQSDISAKDKEFLKLAAYRHVVFDYHRIAEYYAHSDPKVQELMEDSALVIIDYGKAIEQGFIDFVTDVMEEIDD